MIDGSLNSHTFNNKSLERHYIADLRLSAANPVCPSYIYFFMKAKDLQAQHDYKSDHHSESFKRCKYLLR